MCGIVAYVGRRPCLPILIEGLKRLEYRGYDSAGVAVQCNGGLRVVKAAGKIRVLEARLVQENLPGTAGIAHTRWATHGAPTVENAHPHTDCDGRIAIVHNGIIDNYAKIKASLASKYKFVSETDTEVIPHLIRYHMESGLSFEKAFFKTSFSPFSISKNPIFILDFRTS